MILPQRSIKLDEFTLGYIYSALWELEEQFDISDIHPANVSIILDDCTSFQIKHKELLNNYYQTYDGSFSHKILPEHLGHDYWSARNGKVPEFITRINPNLAQQFIQICQKEGQRKIIYDGEDINIIEPIHSLKAA